MSQQMNHFASKIKNPIKKTICIFLTILLVFGLFSCGNNAENDGKDQPKAPKASASEADISKLEGIYTGLTAHHGQLHDHANTGRRSDGKYALTEWIAVMPSVGMEYAAILDHRQTDHMYLDEWDPTLFISGSEAMTHVIDRPEYCNKYHYNMIFPSVKEMEDHLNQFPLTYRFVDGLFEYLHVDSATFTDIINSVLDKGGYFVIPHPLQTDPEQIEITDPMIDPLDYFYIEHIGYEVLYSYYNNEEKQTKAYQDNYWLWTSLLAADKRVYCSAASDRHSLPSNHGLSTVYSDKMLDTSYITQLRLGNYTAGPIGVRMIVGDTLMGGTGTFEGQRLVFSVGDFHKDFQNPDSKYRVDLLSDTGVVFSQTITPGETTFFAIDADPNVKFYRVEIHDESKNYSLTALGNPIWNSAYFG